MNYQVERSRCCSLLLVEDDDAFALALAALLEADGRFEIVGRAHNGREGVELAAALDPAVVLMDIRMPVMDGIEATRQIQQRHPSPPVLLVSGSEYEESALEGREAGAVDFIRKGRLEFDLVEALLAAAAAARATDLR